MKKKIQRDFIIGDKWLYYKIYLGYNTSDKILIELIKPLAEYLIKKKIIDKWFFIRYNDPDHHLRIRFYNEKDLNSAFIIKRMNQLLKKWMEIGIIWKVQIDTYSREIERYGIEGMELSESVFFQDSIMTLNLISLLDGAEGERLRWLFSLKGVDALLDAFNYSNTEKLKLLENLKNNFGQEFGRNKFLNTQLNDKYRIEKKNIFQFMCYDLNDEENYLMAILNNKNESLKKDISLFVNSSGKQKKDKNDFVASHIHMMMNRIFRSENRTHEMVCYEFLYKFYLTINNYSKK